MRRRSLQYLSYHGQYDYDRMHFRTHRRGMYDEFTREKEEEEQEEQQPPPFEGSRSRRRALAVRWSFDLDGSSLCGRRYKSRHDCRHSISKGKEGRTRTICFGRTRQIKFLWQTIPFALTTLLVTIACCCCWCSAFLVAVRSPDQHHRHSRTYGYGSSHGRSRTRNSRATIKSVDGDREYDRDRDDVGYHFRDSWSLITLGDLHMEDDMMWHEQARQDCITALQRLPLLATRTRTTQAAVSSTETTDMRHDDGNDSVIEIPQSVIEQWETMPVSKLSGAQLELILERQKVRENEVGNDPNLCKSYLVSLGDLGRKDIRHEPGDAGTTKSFVDAKDYLDGFFGRGIPDGYQKKRVQSRYELVSGNHDLEGLDEFSSDESNLNAWMQCFDKQTPQFARQIGERTLLVGLSTVRFRDSPYSSHECHVDDEQLRWFEETIRSHPAADGWKILVFSHAPILGSGLRVLQNVHITNGCAWMNHCSPPEIRNRFIQIVKENPQIKVWSSGHFHLSHDYEDAIRVVETTTNPITPRASAVNRGGTVDTGDNVADVESKSSYCSSCAFLQVGVMGPKSCRDGKRQSRLLRGCGERIEIYTINHHERLPNRHYDSNVESVSTDSTVARVRLDATIDIQSGEVTLEDNTVTLNDDDPSHGLNEEHRDPNWFQAYVPKEEDGCYLDDVEGSIGDWTLADLADKKVCWWHMADGKVLGLHSGQLIEYDTETLSPLGVVVSSKQLANREILLVQNKTVLVLVDDETQETEVIHPNNDGSYWRKFQRNKKIRLEEKAREEVAKRWLEEKKQLKS